MNAGERCGLVGAVLALVLLATGCTPAMHRAYQVGMVSIGAAGVVHSGLQTNVALRHDANVRESNPALGSTPSILPIVGAVAISLSAGAGVLALPRGERTWNGRALPDWTIDVLATTYAAFGVFLAWNDTTMTDVRWYR